MKKHTLRSGGNRMKNIMAAMLFLFGLPKIAQAQANRGINFQIYVIDESTGNPLSSGIPVTVVAQVLSPRNSASPSQCILREETFTNVVFTNGYALVTIGNGVTDSNDPGLSFTSLFQNSMGAMIGTMGCVYTPAPADGRVAQVSFVSPTDGTNIVSSFPLSSEPFALAADEASTLQGLPASGFVKVNPTENLTQSSVESYFSALSSMPAGDTVVPNGSGGWTQEHVVSNVTVNSQIQDSSGNISLTTLNLPDFTSAVNSLISAITAPIQTALMTLTGRVSFDESNITTLTGTVNTAVNTTIPGIQTTTASNSGSITVLQGQVSSLQTQVNGFGTAVTLSAGVAPGDLVQLGAPLSSNTVATLPAVDGSQLMGVVVDWSNVQGAPQLVTNAGGTPSIVSGTNNNKWSISSPNPQPAIGTIYFATDTQQIFQFETTSSSTTPTWVQMGGQSAILANQIQGIIQQSQVQGIQAMQSAVSALGSAADLTAGTGAYNAVQLDSAAKLPAVDGSQLTGLTMSQILGTLPVSKGGTGQSTAYAAGNVVIGGTEGTSLISGPAITTSGASNSVVELDNSGNLTANIANLSSAIFLNDITVNGLNIGSGNSVSSTISKNTLLGVNALQQISTSQGSTGFANTAIGNATLSADQYGVGNTAIGQSSMANNYAPSDTMTACATNSTNSSDCGSGSFNTAVGQNSLASNITGGSNVAIGQNSLASNTTGGSNVAIGHSALVSNTTGSVSVAIGDGALGSNIGNSNTAVGTSAFGSLSYSDAVYNIAIGTWAGGHLNAPRSNNNTIIGGGVMSFATNTPISGTVAIGANAMICQSGSGNTAVGTGALAGTCSADLSSSADYNSGGGNTAIGNNTMSSLTTGSSNTAIGASALGYTTTGSNLVAVGSNALANNTTGGYNIAIGQGALQSNSGVDVLTIDPKDPCQLSGGTPLSASCNLAVGNGAMFENTTGSSNIALGDFSLGLSKTGAYNVAIGQSALGAIQDKRDNIAIGWMAMATSTGDRNIAIGSATLGPNGQGGIGDDNIAIGYQALSTNASGNKNVALGNSSLSNITTGSSNIAVGANLGLNIVTGNSNTVVGGGGSNGEGAINNFLKTDPSNQVIIGDGDGNIVFSADASNPQVITATIPNLNVTGNLTLDGILIGTPTTLSDERLKKDIVQIPDALSKISKLRGVSYNWKLNEQTKKMKLGNKHQIGVIAQEVEKVFPEAVVDNKREGFKSVSYTSLIGPIIEAIKELANKSNDKDKQIELLENENASLRHDINGLKQYLCQKDPTAALCE